MSFECAVYLQVLHPQGKNIKEDEFHALGDMLASISWELPQVQEYKGDLMEPEFIALSGGVPAITNQSSAPPPSSHPDPNGPCSQVQWIKVQKMVAWLRFSLQRIFSPFPPCLVFDSLVFRVKHFFER